MIITFCSFNNGFGQTLEGYVYDSVTDDPVPEVAVSLYVSGQLIDVQNTDDTGLFLFHKIPSKGYKLIFRRSRYRTLTRNHRFVSTKRNSYKLISIEEPEFAKLHTDSIRLIDSDQYYTRAKLEKSLITFSDPIRVLALAPGAALVNDRSNAISFQGIPATFNKWYLDGFEINNPNQYSFQGSYENLFESGGGMTSSFNNYKSISITSPGMADYSTSTVGAAINYESGEITNFAKFGNTGTEIGLHKGRFNVGVKFGSPNLLSNLGNDNGWENSGDGAVNINYRNITAKKTDVMNFYYNRSYYARLKNQNQVTDIDTYSKRFSSLNWGVTKSFRYKSLKIGFSHSVTDQEYNYRYEYYNSAIITRSFNKSVETTLTNYSIENTLNDNSSISLSLNSINNDQYYFESYNYYTLGYNLRILSNNIRYEFILQPRYYRFYKTEKPFSPDVSINMLFAGGNYISVSHNSQILNNSFFDRYLIKSFAFSSNFGKNINNESWISINPFCNYFYELPMSDGLIFSYTYPLNGIDYSKGKAITYGVNWQYAFNPSDRLKLMSSLTWLNSINETFYNGWIKSEFDYKLSNSNTFHYNWILRKNRILSLKISTNILIGKQLISRAYDKPFTNFGNLNYFRLDAGLEYQTPRGKLNLTVHNLGNIQNDGFLYYDNLEQDFRYGKQTGMVPFLSYSFTF